MKEKTVIALTGLSTIALIIEIVLFGNMGIYVDEHSTSPDVVYGGFFWLNMAWLKLFLLFVITIFFWKKVFEKK